MKTKTVQSSWLDKAGRRLDCGPYVSGAVEARATINSVASRRPLHELCEHGAGGIYHAGRETRRWVNDPSVGVPFLGSTDILAADLGGLSLIARSQVERNPRLLIREGWTLLTRTGTIGRIAYCRPDMDGLACSEHVMRVVPDATAIPPGYLYAFLASKYGIPMITGGTYGSIIQSIEPEHIVDLPVPRFDNAFESEVHALVIRAASLRAQASAALTESIALLERLCGLNGLERPSAPMPFDTSEVSSRQLQTRLDGFFHSRFHATALESLSRVKTITIESLATRVIEPPRFKRVAVDDERFGVPLFGTSALFWADPVASYLLPRRMPHIDQYLVDNQCLLIPRSGQLSGIIGSAILPHGAIVGAAVSEDAIRIHFDSEADCGYCFVALNSEYGRRQLKARAFGSSIPHLDVKQINQVRIPDPGESHRASVGEQGVRIGQLRNEACRMETRARGLVEDMIEERAR